MSAYRGNRLRTLADLGDRHLGRTITIRGLTGVLTGVIPVRDRIALALTVVGARAFTDAFPATEHVEVHQRHQPQCERCGQPGELVGQLVLCPEHTEETP